MSVFCMKVTTTYDQNQVFCCIRKRYSEEVLLEKEKWHLK